MKAMYPALFEKEDNCYNVTFPDLPEAITCGDTLEQAIEMAKECFRSLFRCEKSKQRRNAYYE